MSKSSLQRATAAAIDLLSTSQGLLASNMASDLNDLMQGMVKGTATIYDKAMDATYIATHEGGGYHWPFDGGHTLSGAVSAGHSASADDGIIQEALGTLQGLLRDGTTPMGMPVVTWDKTTLQAKAAGTQLKDKGWMKLPLPGSGRRRSPDSPDAPARSNPG